MASKKKEDTQLLKSSTQGAAADMNNTELLDIIKVEPKYEDELNSFLTDQYFLINYNTSGVSVNQNNIVEDCETQNLDQYKCNQCNFTTISQALLTRHITSNHSIRENVTGCVSRHHASTCYQCDPPKKCKKNLNGRHGSTKFKCDQCDYQTSVKKNFTIHVNSCHSSSAQLNYSMPVLITCGHCGYMSCNNKYFTKNIKIFHGSNLRAYECDQCDDVIKWNDHLSEFKCYCDYTTKDKTEFTKHVDTKHSLIEFKCIFCEYNNAKNKGASRCSTKYKCNLCNFITESIFGLSIHVNCVHLVTWLISPTFLYYSKIN